MKTRLCIYLVAFISGCVLLGLELLASRILAPFFGNSIYVWGAIISVFLLALSLGYFLGGKVADWKPSFNMLGRILVVTAVFTTLVPFLANPLSYAVLGFGLDIRVSVLVATNGLFLIPSVLMGMVSPYVIKLSTTAFEELGQSAGNVYAISTMGSIAGAIAVSFFLIPSIGSRNIVFISAGMLLVASSLCFYAGLAKKQA